MKKRKSSIKEPAVILTNITKRYILHHEKPTFSEKLFRRGKKEIFTALDDITLTIQKGEKVGIVGKNGAGKTTLLKIIAGITAATQGQVILNGRVVSLIDLEAGFHPELTGRENIFLNGLIIGMSKKEIGKKITRIISFADIGNFIDEPLFTYSAGMKLRLGFSIAVHANPEILILDEGISVGDESFRKKSSDKIESFFTRGKTIILVSHWLGYMQEHVNRVIWMDERKVAADGPAKKVISLYQSKVKKK